VTIENLELVEERDGWALYRCGQPDEDGFRELLRLGVNAILKMNARQEFSDTEEARLFAPGTVDLLPLTTDFPDSDYAREAVKMIQALTDAGKRVAIHCSHGRDRTGFVVAAWRILACGWSVERADEERRKFGPTASDEDVLDSLGAIADSATLSDAELQELGLDSDYLTRLKDPKS
jgi:protein tyrosine/serine phosphatase